ncbi:putative dTDP-4-dehydrorhamnose reductase [Kaistia sp. 32K]|uniref:dTDP-4-dehydrorhamnose reductase n=1 Tax=Kaistia sp. 32K TaxID=2795690 RepID=UPI0019168C91|nr:dTDP-4-dehydrorhamnose reductase [Kaistia sp. 32K]BCP54521.1 putative dTDP-4-dehydrorhamnose reductase [Kaistia sp. 32K]
MRIFVAGSSGQLARALKARAAQHGHVVETFGRPALDLAVPGDFEGLIAAQAPDVVINAAAYTAVDRAESEAGLAMAVNRGGAGHLAAAARRLGLPFLHVSTDYVFDGEKGAPYVEGDATAPLGVYGTSKFEGEAAVLDAHPEALIFRTGWVYGADGGNFVRTMVRLAGEREHLDIVADRFGNPTHAADLADALLAIAPQARSGAGIFHLAGSVEASWFDLAEGVMAQLEAAGRTVPALGRISGDAYVAPAPRPRDSRLDCSLAERTFGVRLPGWPDSLGAAVAAILIGERKAR